MTVNVPVRELVDTVSAPFERARAMPPSVYTSQAFLQAELEHVFARDWVSVGRASGLENPGDYIAYELAGQPIVVLRDGQGVLRAFSNVCRHRMSTLLEGSGSTRAIVCPYHGWTYNLDGSLRAAPAMTRNAAFCKEDYRLPAVRCEEWLGWIMVTLNPDAPPVAQELAEVEALIEDFDMSSYVETFRETLRWDTNWKVLAENFMESYHLPVCHADTIGGLSKLDEMVCPPGKRDVQLSLDSQGRHAEDRARPPLQHAAERRPAANDVPAVGLSEPADHDNARLFLVSLAASARAGAGRHHLWRRHVGRFCLCARGAGAFRGGEDPVGRSQ